MFSGTNDAAIPEEKNYLKTSRILPSKTAFTFYDITPANDARVMKEASLPE